MISSILTSTKKALGLDEDYTAFDPELIQHINGALATLSELGVGPTGGYMIEGKDAVWESLLGDDLQLNSVRSYVFLKVKLIFDPPATSFHLDAVKEQIAQLEWRLNVISEHTGWVPPVIIVVEEDGWTS